MKSINKQSSVSLTKVTHADFWSDDTWNIFHNLMKTYNIQDPKIVEAVKERSPILMYIGREK